MHHPLKLAVADGNEGRLLILDRAAQDDRSETSGLIAALTCAPAKAMFTGQDAHAWVAHILNHAAKAPESELPGLAAALECLLSIEERPAAELIDEIRDQRCRARRAVRVLRRLRRRGA